MTCGERIYRIAPNGLIEWKSDLVGIDGVIVQDIHGNTIEGVGEWDPPGDWQPFRVRLDSGQLEEKV